MMIMVKHDPKCLLEVTKSSSHSPLDRMIGSFTNQSHHNQPPLLLLLFTFTFTAIRLTPGTLTKVSAAKIKKTALFALFASSLPRLYINTTIRKLLFFASHFYGRLSSSAAGSITPSAAHSTCAASI